MSLSGALFNAFSGLTANARAASIVASNISNATTEGYGRRTLELSSQTPGSAGGVVIDGVTRHSDPVLLADRRLTDAQLGFSSDLQAFSRRMEDAVGASDQPGSLMGRYVAFENALIIAGNNPSSEQQLRNVATAAGDVATSLRSLSQMVQDERLAADGRIDAQVDTLNTSLERVKELNLQIQRGLSRDGDVSSLLDERQRTIDSISQIVPLRVVDRDHGQVSLFTTRGGVLLDATQRSEFAFAPTTAIAAGDTLGGGGLSGLTVNGFAVDTSNDGLFGGGTLAAQFRIRDEIGVQRQAELDGLARDLAERLGANLEAPGFDPSDPLAPVPLLSTDYGVFVDPTNATLAGAITDPGLAGRIEVNPALTIDTNELWRWRDGVSAAAPGNVGDATLLQLTTEALDAHAAPGAAALPNASRGFGTRLSEFISAIANDRVRLEDERSYANAQNVAMRELELSQAVDTDQELQTLMRVEQQYAANAQVMNVVDELMERLMNI